MKYLVTGVNGQLGYDIVREMKNNGYSEVLGTSRDTMDITDRERVLNVISSYKPDVIFHCAAWTQVDKAEDNFDLVYKVNVEGTRNVVDASIINKSKLFYISTDYIFDGKKDGMYDEGDMPNPQNVYGLTKYLGEMEARRNPNHFIARISWVFGINGNNFIKTMLKLAVNHDSLNVVDDQIGSPTYSCDLAKTLIKMASTEKYGIYNITNSGFCSWAELANYIFNTSKLDVFVNHVSTDEYIKNSGLVQAKRPHNSMLSKTKLKEKGFEVLPNWQNAVDRFIDELNDDQTLKLSKKNG